MWLLILLNKNLLRDTKTSSIALTKKNFPEHLGGVKTFLAWPGFGSLDISIVSKFV